MGGLVTRSCLTLATPWILACQAPLSMEFSRQEYWSELPGIKPASPVSPALAVGCFTTVPPEKPNRIA